MKTQMRLFMLAAVSFLVKAQAEETAMPDFKFPLENYRPLLNQAQVETEITEQSEESIQIMRFPALETNCSGEQDTQCGLKENGKQMDCVMTMTQDASEVTAFEMQCFLVAQEESSPRRVRRSRGGRGGSRRGGSRSRGRGRSGRGSSIAGNSRSSGTRHA